MKNLKNIMKINQSKSYRLLCDIKISAKERVANFLFGQLFNVSYFNLSREAVYLNHQAHVTGAIITIPDMCLTVDQFKALFEEV